METETGGETAWAFADQLGSVVAWGTHDGGVWSLKHLSFDAFGNVDAETADLAVGALPAIWAGHQFDAATGLYHMQARWYDPQTGRFLTPDPISFSAGDANLYRYVGNDSVNAIDPDGLETLIPGSGHHYVPWEWITSEEFRFSRAVQDVWNSNAGRIAGDWFNTHDGRTMNDIMHGDYNKLVKNELDTFLLKKKITASKLTTRQAQEFLDIIKSKPVDDPITKFNAGVRAERDFAGELGEALYREKRAKHPRMSTDRIKKEVLGEVSDLIKTGASKGTKIETVLKRLATGKHVAKKIIKPLAAVGYFWATIRGREADAAGIRGAAIDLTPLGYATAAGDGLGEFYEYALEQTQSARTGDEWVRGRSEYDPRKDRTRINLHGINPNGLR